ncbi:uncharacterized protein [Apostichopus japonicus]|uniref:uncharacterized protein isoform X3 n=1 Tax=Stichopus japonicus TaxID=307972 RepID=UPI003AB8EBAA
MLRRIHFSSYCTASKKYSNVMFHCFHGILGSPGSCKHNMAENWFKIATFFGVLLFVNTTEYCDQKELYLGLGSRGLVSCDFGEFGVVGWLVGEDVYDRSPTILVENSRNQGPGYESGEYDMFQNGSLIINNVTLKHEQMFTARIVRGSDVEHYTIEVKLYVLPVPIYPVVNGLTNQQRIVIDDYSGGQVNCAMDRVRPNIELELVFLDNVPQDVSLSSIHSSVNNTDGTYNVSLVSNLTVGSSLIGILTLQCRVTGQMANLFPAVTLIDLVLNNGHWQSYPTINGLTNQQHVVLDINREDELTCSWNGVPKYGYLKWDIINPSSDGIIITDHRTHTRDNGDGTYDLSLHSTLSVPNPSVLRVTLHCKEVAAPTDQWYPEITTAELLLPANSFPVINGLTSQQHVVLYIQRTDVLTCSMHRVSQEVSLQWLIITPASSEDISLDDQLSRSNNEDGTVNIALNSTVKVTSLSINRVTLQCKVSGLPADSPQVFSTQVELLLPPNCKEDLQTITILLDLVIGILIVILIVIVIVILLNIHSKGKAKQVQIKKKHSTR